MAEFVIGKNACPFTGCGSSDGFHWYGEGNGGYCYSCNKSILSDERKAELGLDAEDDYEEEVVTREKITPEENERIKARTGTDGKGYRGITKEINTFFGVRYEYDEATGEPIKQYVPTTINGELCGYRTRKFPKDFSHPIGQVGKECDMVFQFRFKTHTKTCIISGGETKALNTYRMLYEHQVARGKTDYETVAVVCSTLGESGAHKQVQAQYAFFEQFDRVLVCMDQDEAGIKATEEIVKVLPKGKAWVLKMRYKDADEYVEKGKQQEFINDYYAAKKYVPHGVTASTDISEKMREFLMKPRLSFPPYLHKLQKKLRGGLPVCIFNILSASGTGKSTHVDAMTLHWIMNENKLVGIVPMETCEGEYGVNLLSSYAEVKMNLFETVDERLAFIDREDTKALERELFYKEDGNPRFYILDAEAETLKDRVEYLIVSLECKIIIIDPIQDVFDMLGEDEQAKFMGWMKGWMKKGITFVNVNHSRKSGQGQKANSKGADLSEEDMMGHSSIFKSGGVNLILMRNKEAEDEVEKNTTFMKLTKARGVGDTGIVGKYYYEMEKHKIHDLDDWLTANPQHF
jgi:KaiC/GvpD/RAD55 family RecA-like ATPase